MAGDRGALRERAFQLRVTGTACEVSALSLVPTHSRTAFVMAHGAGAGMRHPFMQAMAERLAAARIATLRYQFPYMEEGRRRPDPHHLLEATVRAAATEAARVFGTLPLFAGGKSMGGRMTSQAQAREPLPGIGGIAFLGFPLHPAGAPSDKRAAHLVRVGIPMLFLQGDRDALARLDLLEPVCRRLGPSATLGVIADADHSFKVLKRSGRTEEEVLDELAGAIGEWSESLPAR